MKKLLLVLIITLFGVLNLFTDTRYIKARVCPMHIEANVKSEKILTLSINTSISILNIEESDWSYVKVGNIRGYIRSMFLSSKPAVVVTSVADNKKDLSSVEIRKRASNFSSSVAAIRGLSSENVRDRDNVKFSNYDFESVVWIEKNFSYSYEDIIEFSSSELFNP